MNEWPFSAAGDVPTPRVLSDLQFSFMTFFFLIFKKLFRYRWLYQNLVTSGSIKLFFYSLFTLIHHVL